jgi:hypothetical protein
MNLSIEELGVSQLYLSEDKIHNVQSWFNPSKIKDYEPLPVRDFYGKGQYVLTDGHSRAYLYYKSGITSIPVVIDQDDIVTCGLGTSLYREYIAWCERYHIHTVKDLEHRIIPSDDYNFLWLKRCDRHYHLIHGIGNRISPEHYEELKRQGEIRDLTLYGADEELSCLYYEDLKGNLWIYRQGQFILERCLVI